VVLNLFGPCPLPLPSLSPSCGPLCPSIEKRSKLHQWGLGHSPSHKQLLDVLCAFLRFYRFSAFWKLTITDKVQFQFFVKNLFLGHRSHPSAPWLHLYFVSFYTVSTIQWWIKIITLRLTSNYCGSDSARGRVRTPLARTPDDNRVGLRRTPDRGRTIPGGCTPGWERSRPGYNASRPGVILSACAWTPSYNWKNIDAFAERKIATDGRASSHSRFFIVVKDRLCLYSWRQMLLILRPSSGRMKEVVRIFRFSRSPHEASEITATAESLILHKTRRIFCWKLQWKYQ